MNSSLSLHPVADECQQKWQQRYFCIVFGYALQDNSVAAFWVLKLYMWKAFTDTFNFLYSCVDFLQLNSMSESFCHSCTPDGKNFQNPDVSQL